MHGRVVAGPPSSCRPRARNIDDDDERAISTTTTTTTTRERNIDDDETCGLEGSCSCGSCVGTAVRGLGGPSHESAPLRGDGHPNEGHVLLAEAARHVEVHAQLARLQYVLEAGATAFVARGRHASDRCVSSDRRPPGGGGRKNGTEVRKESAFGTHTCVWGVRTYMQDPRDVEGGG